MQNLFSFVLQNWKTESKLQKKNFWDAAFLVGKSRKGNI